jgi:septum formation protein
MGDGDNNMVRSHGFAAFLPHLLSSFCRCRQSERMKKLLLTGILFLTNSSTSLALITPALLPVSKRSTSSSSLSMSLLVSHMQHLDVGVKLILASQSPRRREILDMMGLRGKYTTTPSPLDESLLQQRLAKEDPKIYTRILAEEKAKALAENLTVKVPTLVLGSDTIVDLEGKILEKPTDADSAVAMLKQLSNNYHQVHTGVAIYLVQEKDVQLVTSFIDTANVKFTELTEEDIQAYVKTEEPMDKAGSYGIQGIGGQFVEKMEGDFFTVMGLPMHRVSTELTNAIKSIMD